MCGIAACVGADYSAHIVKHLLIQIQHRGQEGAGLAWITPQGQHRLIRNFGYVVNAIPDVQEQAPMAIGHVRYSTTGTYTRKIEELHPMYIEDGENVLFLAFNGTIANYKQLRKELEQYYTFVTDTDTEVLLKLIHREIKLRKDIIEGVRQALTKVQGSYSLVLMTKNVLVLARDPYGFKPLSILKKDNILLACSESCALTTLMAETTDNIMEVEPGQIILCTKDLEIFYNNVDREPERRAFCAFEYVYFARPDTIFNGVVIYDARRRMGELLGEDENETIDIVVPIPETGRVAAYGYAYRTGKPIEDILVKVRYLGRSFIMPKELRSQIARFGIVSTRLRGRSIALVDDSLVRGTTMRNLVNTLRRLGACKIHVRIASPPIRYPCFMGIDFPTRQELVAHGRDVEEVRKIIEADTLRYLSVENLVKAIGLPEKDLCLACFTGQYPIPLDVSEKEREFYREG